jgi:prophage DNA circulation protein
VFALSIECQLIADMSFESREDVELVQGRMKNNFDAAKEWAADEMDNISYAQLVDMSAKLARYLADTALPLPTIVYYQLQPLPALVWAYRIYADTSRYEELMGDNKVVHPLFMHDTVRALSA